MTEVDVLDLYDRASTWTLTKVRGAVGKLESPTPCDDWDARSLLNHILDTQRYFTGTARGEDVSRPSPTPPSFIGENPVPTFEKGRSDLMQACGEPGVMEKIGPALGIAFADQLLHGWDLAQATEQDSTMPDGLPAAAYQMIHGRFTDEPRQGLFKPAIAVPSNASPQVKLLAYTGRDPFR
jgi:uncharacterized protein (TIGR03086 family)